MFPEVVPSVQGYKEIPIRENNEPLVALGPFSEYRDIYTDAIYAGERISSPYIDNPVEGSLLTMFVRRGVAERLRAVQGCLSRTERLVVLDAYRTVQTQQALFDRYMKALVEKRPDLNEEERLAWTINYVSLPSTDPKKPATHNTGGSVDVTFCFLPDEQAKILGKIDNYVDKKSLGWKEAYRLEIERATIMSRYGEQCPVPTRFDYGKEEASHNYSRRRPRSAWTREESLADYTVRRLLSIMHNEGLEPIESEWWHYNSGKTQMGAKSVGLALAEYGPAILSVENLRHEQMRKDHLIAMRHLREGWKPNFRDPKYEYYELIREVNKKTPDWEFTVIPKSEKISP